MAKRPTCDTPGCHQPIPKGGEGHPEMCPDCLAIDRVGADRVNLVAFGFHCGERGFRACDDGEAADSWREESDEYKQAVRRRAAALLGSLRRHPFDDAGSDDPDKGPRRAPREG